MTLVGSYDTSGTGLSFNGLAYDPTTGVMYGCSSTALYTVSMVTGDSSWIGNFGITYGCMIGIAFDGSGNLYGIDIYTNSLYSIAPGSGAVTLIAPLTDTSGNPINLNYGQDMAFDLDTGILYLSARTWLDKGYLYTCNVITGICTNLGQFQGNAQITGFAIPYGVRPDLIIHDMSSGTGTVNLISNNIYEPPIWPAVTQVGKWFFFNGGVILDRYIGLIELQNDGPVPMTGHTISATYLPGSPLLSACKLFYLNTAAIWSSINLLGTGGSSSTTNGITVAPATSTFLLIFVITMSPGVRIGVDVASAPCVDSVIFAPC